MDKKQIILVLIITSIPLFFVPAVFAKTTQIQPIITIMRNANFTSGTEFIKVTTIVNTPPFIINSHIGEFSRLGVNFGRPSLFLQKLGNSLFSPPDRKEKFLGKSYTILDSKAELPKGPFVITDDCREFSKFPLALAKK